jgi:hypothetical protein
MPDFGTDWAAVGIMDGDRDKFPYMVQLDSLKLALERDETFNVLFSFYGPNGQQYANVFADGLFVDANRFDLTAAGIALISVGESRQVPALFKEKWQKRWDIRADFRRRVQRVYTANAIEQLDQVLPDGATAGLDNEQYITSITVNPPTP